MATKKLTPKQSDKVCELANLAGVPDGFDPFDKKAIRAELKKHKDAAKNLEKVLAIIAPAPKEKA
jgi:hypothetical protein